jgi:hypothetical protein
MASNHRHFPGKLPWGMICYEPLTIHVRLNNLHASRQQYEERNVTFIRSE